MLMKMMPRHQKGVFPGVFLKKPRCATRSVSSFGFRFIIDSYTPSPHTSQSIKCSECGKIFKTTALANYHAEKSGHDQFEESTEEVCLSASFPSLKPQAHFIFFRVPSYLLSR